MKYFIGTPLIAAHNAAVCRAAEKAGARNFRITAVNEQRGYGGRGKGERP
jgi:hypothetical protein